MLTLRWLDLIWSETNAGNIKILPTFYFILILKDRRISNGEYFLQVNFQKEIP